MKKRFNVTGICIPEKHYMVDISRKLEQIVEEYIDPGYYFAINRGRQYGKTTTLYQLEQHLNSRYHVISISFEGADDMFESRDTFVHGFVDMVGRELNHAGIDSELIEAWLTLPEGALSFQILSDKISMLCTGVDKEVVLQIDEVDKSSDNQLFLTFLGMLRDKYLEREKGRERSFHNVILSGVYDIKNLKLKIRPNEEHKYNSPWNTREGNESNGSLLPFDDCPWDYRELAPYNIAEQFNIDMSFSNAEISTMLQDYEDDNHYDIDVVTLSKVLYEYTSGYPYLVSQICKLMDETIWRQSAFETRKAVWCPDGIRCAIKEMLMSRSPLFDDINKNLDIYPKLNEMIHHILLKGMIYPYSLADDTIQIGTMFGYFKPVDYKVAISNRIFETYLYDLFYLNETKNSELASAGAMEHSQFIKNGYLDMDKVLERFKAHYDSIYGAKEWKFIEDEGRFLFLTFLKPIINGKGHYYVEARTRDQRRTDIIVEYNGRQYIIETKIWRGEEYQSRGRIQLWDYMDSYEQKKGWLVSFCFNKTKEKSTGIKKLTEGGKEITEVII